MRDIRTSILYVSKIRRAATLLSTKMCWHKNVLIFLSRGFDCAKSERYEDVKAIVCFRKVVQPFVMKEFLANEP